MLALALLALRQVQIRRCGVNVRTSGRERDVDRTAQADPPESKSRTTTMRIVAATVVRRRISWRRRGVQADLGGQTPSCNDARQQWWAVVAGENKMLSSRSASNRRQTVGRESWRHAISAVGERMLLRVSKSIVAPPTLLVNASVFLLLSFFVSRFANSNREKVHQAAGLKEIGRSGRARRGPSHETCSAVLAALLLRWSTVGQKSGKNSPSLARMSRIV